MNTPVFSVILPVYNSAETLYETVRSVLTQSESRFELIVVDDGSTDDSLRLALSIAGEDERVRVVSQENKGVSAARNLGAELARGELLAFIDADDRWHEDKLRQHRLLHLTHPSVDASFARIAFRESKNGQLLEPKTHSTVPVGALSLVEVIGENPVCTASNLVVSRKAFERAGPFRVGMNHAEDQEWLARFVDRGGHVLGISETLVDYRMSEGGLSADLNGMLAGWWTLTEPYRDQINMASAEALYCRYLARRALRTGGPAQHAIGFAAQGMRANPSAFLSDFRRGALTLAGALLSPIIPAAVRPRLFA